MEKHQFIKYTMAPKICALAERIQLHLDEFPHYEIQEIKFFDMDGDRGFMKAIILFRKRNSFDKNEFKE